MSNQTKLLPHVGDASRMFVKVARFSVWLANLLAHVLDIVGHARANVENLADHRLIAAVAAGIIFRRGATLGEWKVEVLLGHLLDQNGRDLSGKERVGMGRGIRVPRICILGSDFRKKKLL